MAALAVGDGCSGAWKSFCRSQWYVSCYCESFAVKVSLILFRLSEASAAHQHSSKQNAVCEGLANIKAFPPLFRGTIKTLVERIDNSNVLPPIEGWVLGSFEMFRKLSP